MTRRLRISEVHERVQPFFERYGAEVMFERGAGEEVENGEFIPEKPRKLEIKSEIQQEESVVEKWQKDDLEKGEFVPGGWLKGNVEKGDLSSERYRRGSLRRMNLDLRELQKMK